MPVGAFGGRKEIFQHLAPLGPVYQAGTLSGNPVAMTAGITTLRILKEHPEIYTHIAAIGGLAEQPIKTNMQIALKHELVDSRKSQSRSPNWK